MHGLQNTSKAKIFMSDLHWAAAIDHVAPYVFRVKTGKGHGSGCLITMRKNGLCGIATAWHVVNPADEWGEPIKLQHHHTKKELLLNAANRAIYKRHDRDVALIIFQAKDLDLPKEELTLSPEDKWLKQGLSLGWLGFPAVAPTTLCFFEGKASAFDTTSDYYLVDGVAINGVSGGPALRITEHTTQLLGCVSAYIPNRAGGDSLPGLCVVQSISPFYGFLSAMKSIEDAQEKVAEQKQADKEQKGDIGE